jgi:hypothetical protein
MQRKLWTLLAMLSVLCFAAPSRSGNTVSGTVHLMDYEQASGLMLGYPDDQPPLGWFKRTEHTVFVPGPPSEKYPPSPCRGIARAWNVIVTIQNPDLETLKHQALDRLLVQMGQHECNAYIERSVNNSPADVVTFNPTP